MRPSVLTAWRNGLRFVQVKQVGVSPLKTRCGGSGLTVFYGMAKPVRARSRQRHAERSRRRKGALSSRRYPSAMESHIRVPVGEECLLPATVCADEYFSLFSIGAVGRLNQLEPQLATAHAAQRGLRLDEGTHVISSTLRSEEKRVET